jgi:class 3 adenylate cyclase
MASKATNAKKDTQRKLTAILCVDVVGYSRLMGGDEIRTAEGVKWKRQTNPGNPVTRG